MPLDDLRTSDLDRAEAALTRASAALRSSETDFDAAVTLVAIWKRGMQRARRWGVVHLRAGREIGEWWHRVKRRRGRPKLGNSPIFPTSTQLADKLGVDRRDITRFEVLAHIPADVFEEYLLDADAPSYSGCIACAQPDTAPAFGSAHPVYSKQFLKVPGHGVATATCQNAALFAMTEWLTPPEFFDAMEVRFDLDVASPGARIAHWIPAHRHLTQRQDGLAQQWGEAFVWMNCPYGLRNGLLDWIDKFLDHGDHNGHGVALLPDFTSTDWYQQMLNGCDAALFVSPKIQFLPRVADRGNTLGSTAFAIGERGVQALRNAQQNGRGNMLIRER